MDSLYRDVGRLELILKDLKGLESFSLNIRLNDFISYFFKRFLVNFKSITKPFASSELEMFISRHSKKVNLVLSDPLISLKDILIPIPKGMINPYKETLSSLLEILVAINAEIISHDLEIIISNINNSDSVKTLHNPRASLKVYEDCKKTIGSLYSTKGLLNVPGNLAFLRFEDLVITKDILLQTVKFKYPEVIKIHKLVSEIDNLHSEQMISEQTMNSVRDVVMDVAYRVSIFAVVMNHIQELEHAYVKSLNVLITHR